MTANTIVRMPTAPRRVGLVTAWRAERLKVRRSWFLGGVIFLALFAQVLGVGNYLSNQATFESQGATWIAIWAQGAVLVTSIFLPLLYVVVLAHASALEFQARGWQRLAASDRVLPAVLGKALVSLELALTGLAIYLLAAVASGLFLGFDPSQLAPFVARAVCGALGAWAIATVTLLLSTWFRTFAAIASVGLVAVIVGMVSTVVLPPLAGVYPFALITYGMGARDLSGFGSPASMIGTSIVCLFWVGLSVLITTVRIRRREW